MRSGITVGDTIQVRHRGEVAQAKVRKVGTPTRGMKHGLHAWAMLTLDVRGECVYAVAREDELLGWQAT